MTTLDASLQDGAPRAAASHPKLIIASFEPLDQSSHWLNELVSFKTEASALGMSVRILALSSADAHAAASLSAAPVLDPLPALDVNAENYVAQLVAFTETAESLEPLWAHLDAEKPGQQDLIYFPKGHPLLIRGVGLWLARCAPEQRPSVFFRIIGDELTDLDTGRYRARAALYRLACSDLRTRPGQERVFFLVNSKAKARTVSRVCGRRPFMMQHHFGRALPGAQTAMPATPTIYVHLNMRSGRLAKNLSEIVQRVAEAEPPVRFLVKIPAEFPDTIATLKRKAASFAEIISPEQDVAEYFANLTRCSLVWLAYEAQPYKALTSGVFTEAASLGKPVVVPRDTWMAEKIAEGYGVGVLFGDPTARTVAAALLDAVRGSDQLGAAARAIAPRLGEATGCRRFIEDMIAFSRTTPDMEPRYRIGDEIDFSSALDSRAFMRTGWGDNEPWGVWTVDRYAGLELPVDAKAGDRLVLNVLASAFLGKRREPVRVRVSVAGQQIAEWIFDAARFQRNRPRWLTAPLPPDVSETPGGVLNISFEVDAPKSPLSEGLSTDPRTLGLGLSKLSLTAAT
jgi:glycosyltransferase involved in cell wall biosynthesis